MSLLISTEPVKYVLKEQRDKPEGEQVIFHLRALKHRERAAIQDGAIVTEISMVGPKNQQTQGVMRHLSGTQMVKALDAGLVKIENLRGADGNLVKYEKESDSAHKESVLDTLDPTVTKELADEILKLSGFSKEEEKN